MNARLRLVVCSFADARRLVAGWHQRHPDCGPGHLWSVAAVDGRSPVGVAIVGRPTARALDNVWWAS